MCYEKDIFIFHYIFLVVVLVLPDVHAQDYTKWNLPKGTTVRIGKGVITGDIVYSPDGNQLAVPSGIGVWIYDAHTGKEIKLFTKHPNWISSVGVSPDGRILACGSDGNIELWNVQTGQHLKTLTGHTSEIKSIAFSSDGRILASAGDSPFANDNTIHLWNPDTGTHLKTLTGHTKGINTLGFSPESWCRNMPVFSGFAKWKNNMTLVNLV